MVIFALFILVGISLGMLGGGGSILTVPLLVYVADLDAKSAVAMSLLIVAVTSMFGLIPYARRGFIDYKVALVFGPVAMLGAFSGGILAKYFSDTALMLLFALMMLATSTAMLRRGSDKSAPRSEDRPLRRALLLALEGAGVGMFTGLVGAGGGFMVVPALVLLARLEMRTAVGTSLLIIVLKSFAGLAGHLSHESLDWSMALGLSGAAAVGALLGGALAGRVAAGALRKGFGVFVLAMGAFVLAAQLPDGFFAQLHARAAWLGPSVVVLGLLGAGTWVWRTLRTQASRSKSLARRALSGRPGAEATANAD